MAKQVGLIKLEGTIGGITFYKSKDGFIAKELSVVSDERRMNDPAFERTRENNLEFGRVSTAGKIIRAAFRPLAKFAKDSRVASRLVRELMAVIKTDTLNTRGYRTVTDGDLTILQGFEFNNNAVLTQNFFAPFTIAIDRVAGTLTVTIPPFVPADNVKVPHGANHFKIVTMGAQLNFDRQLSVVDEQDSAVLPINGTITTSLTLRNSVTANTTDPLFLALGIQYYQLVNGVEYPLKDESFNSLSLISIDVA